MKLVFMLSAPSWWTSAIKCERHLTGVPSRHDIILVLILTGPQGEPCCYHHSPLQRGKWTAASDAFLSSQSTKGKLRLESSLPSQSQSSYL